MYDAIVAANVPRDGDMYAGYINGSWPTYNTFVAMFGAEKVSSVSTGGLVQHADIADIEYGDFTPLQGAQWCHLQITQGYRPTIYCSRNTYPSMVSSLALYNYQFVRDVDWWCTTLDDTVDIPGAVAIQYKDAGSYDISVIVDDNWYRTAPPPPPLHPLQEGGLMPYIASDGTSEYIVDGNTKCKLVNGTDGGALLKLPQFMGQTVVPTIASLANMPTTTNP